MSEVESYTGVQTLVVNTCWCGVRHAIPKELDDARMRSFNSRERKTIAIYCPLGHKYYPAGEPK